MELSRELAALREECLLLHKGPRGIIKEMIVSDARIWSENKSEHPMIFQARKVANRLRTMPLDIEEGEPIVGKPRYVLATDEIEEDLKPYKDMLADCPPYPGGDNGHFHPDYGTLFKLGISGLTRDVERRLQELDGKDDEKRFFYRSCGIVLDGLVQYITHVGEECERLAKTRENERDRWMEMAAICHHVSEKPPETFHQACQLMFLILVALWEGEDHGQSNYGRMDQTLRPFYERDVAEGRLTAQDAFELICALYIQQNRLHWPGGAVSVMVSGRDEKGDDVTNDLSYLCLAARAATKLVYPTVGVAWHKGMPVEFMAFCMDILGTGIGDPAFFNDHMIVEALRDHGVSLKDACYYMNSTCVEIKPAGTSKVWVTQPYINCPAAILEVMRQERAGELSPSDNFDVFKERVKARLKADVEKAAEDTNGIWNRHASEWSVPLASCLISDCLKNGVDMAKGGARYNWVENSFVGLANLSDSLMAVKKLVFERGELDVGEFYRVLEENFENNEHLLRKIQTSVPQYGVNHVEADRMVKEIAEFLIDVTESCQVGGHRYVPGFFCWVVHETMGREMVATPDGRLAGKPLADGAGPSQGKELDGPSAAILSTTAWDHRRGLGGIVYNAKFEKNFFTVQRKRQAFEQLLRVYMERGGFEIQINVVDNDVLLKAYEAPEDYQDLVVRVAGYSDYFVHLHKNTQREVISRTQFENI